MAKQTPLEQLREMLDDCDGVSFGSVGAHLDEMTKVCDQALAERDGLATHLEWALDAISMAALPVNSDKFNSARAALSKAGAGQ